MTRISRIPKPLQIKNTMGKYSLHCSLQKHPHKPKHIEITVQNDGSLSPGGIHSAEDQNQPKEGGFQLEQQTRCLKKMLIVNGERVKKASVGATFMNIIVCLPACAAFFGERECVCACTCACVCTSVCMRCVYVVCNFLPVK